jgi:ribosomal protein L21E
VAAKRQSKTAHSKKTRPTPLETALLANNLDAQQLADQWNTVIWSLKEKSAGKTVHIKVDQASKKAPVSLQELKEKLGDVWQSRYNEVILQVADRQKKCCQKRCKGCLFGDPTRRQRWLPDCR